MKLFAIAGVSAGDTVSPKRKNKYDFSIVGMISNGMLSVKITYKKKYYSDEIVTTLLENYKKSLLEILNHCMSISLAKDEELIDDIIADNEIKEFTDEITI